MRSLNSMEKVLYPGYTHVVTSRFSYHKGNLDIEVPRGFLLETLPWGSSWVYRNYLYKTHLFSNGRMCTRELADCLSEEVRKREGHTLLSWLLLKISKLNILGISNREWYQKGDLGPKFLGYEEKKDK